MKVPIGLAILPQNYTPKCWREEALQVSNAIS